MSIISLVKNFFNGRESIPSDLELADMGMSKADYHRLMSSADGTRERMETMAEQYGVTPQMIDADRGLAMELAQTCGHCQSAKACQNAMEMGVDFNTARCPNASIYADMSPT